MQLVKGIDVLIGEISHHYLQELFLIAGVEVRGRVDLTIQADKF